MTYFGARFYDPENCRFVTMDPAKDGLNWYEYCSDNPINRIDLDGRFTLEEHPRPYSKAKENDNGNNNNGDQGNNGNNGNGDSSGNGGGGQ